MKLHQQNRPTVNHSDVIIPPAVSNIGGAIQIEFDTVGSTVWVAMTPAEANALINALTEKTADLVQGVASDDDLDDIVRHGTPDAADESVSMSSRYPSGLLNRIIMKDPDAKPEDHCRSAAAILRDAAGITGHQKPTRGEILSDHRTAASVWRRAMSLTNWTQCDTPTVVLNDAMIILATMTEKVRDRLIANDPDAPVLSSDSSA